MLKNSNKTKHSAIYFAGLFLFSLVFSSSSIAQLKIAYVDVPPFAFQSANGQPQGMLIDVFREITRAVNQKPEFIPLPHRRLIHFIEQGHVDLWAGLRNSLISNDLALTSKTPLFEMNLHVYWKEGTKEIQSLSDLDGKKLVLISSYSYGGNLKKLVNESVDVDFVINHEQGFESLFANQDYYLLGYKRIADDVVNKFQLMGFEQAPLAKYNLYLKMLKAHPQAEQFMLDIDQYLLAKREGRVALN